MDNMLEHPGTEIQVLIKDKGLTQKAFASILGKKVSEVNELLKGKRNITIQRDYLLHQTLGTPIKYWILKQIDYDYSLLDIEEFSNSPLDKEGLGEIGSHPEQSEESTAHQTRHSEPKEHKEQSNTTPMNFSLQSKGQEKPEDEIQVAPLDKEEKEEIGDNSKNDEDFKNRANIFKTF